MGTHLLVLEKHEKKKRRIEELDRLQKMMRLPQSSDV
jgi:hypothetical protein